MYDASNMRHGNEETPMTDTSIRVSTDTRKALKRLTPDVGETYDDVIGELIREHTEAQADE